MKARGFLKKTIAGVLCFTILSFSVATPAGLAMDVFDSLTDFLLRRLDGIQTLLQNTDYDYDRGIIIVSLGDSYSAGEGIEVFYGQEKSYDIRKRNPDWLAHRSQESWPGRLVFPGVPGTMKDYRDANWYFVAASGATTNELANEFPKKYYRPDRDGILSGSITNLAPQLDIFEQLRREGKSADYVTLTLGGNDVGFADVITQAVMGSTYLKHYAESYSGLISELNRSPYAAIAPEMSIILNGADLELRAANRLLGSKLDTMLANTWHDFYFGDQDAADPRPIRQKLYDAYHAIANAAGRQATLIVAGYPQLLDRSGRGLPISREEANMIDDSVIQFNREIEALVVECRQEGMKIEFVDVDPLFLNHSAYSSETSYLNEVELAPQSEDLEFKPGSAYSMHPNKQGAIAYAEAVNAKIVELEDRKFSQKPMSLGDAIDGGYGIGIFSGSIAVEDEEADGGMRKLNMCTVELCDGEGNVVYQYNQNGHYGFYLPVIAGAYQYRVTSYLHGFEYTGDCVIEAGKETRVEIPEKLDPAEMYERALALTTRNGEWYESGKGSVTGTIEFFGSEIDYVFDVHVTNYDANDPDRLVASGTGVYGQAGMEMGVGISHANGATDYSYYVMGLETPASSVKEPGSFLLNRLTADMFENVISVSYDAFSLALDAGQINSLYYTSLGYLSEINSGLMQGGTLTVRLQPDRSLKSIEIYADAEEISYLYAAMQCDIVYLFSQEQINEAVELSGVDMTDQEAMSEYAEEYMERLLNGLLSGS
ncbi:MAG: hypothetical protein J5998_04995 [Clostridia bacterium]|nr:hypothetical protein [Clostridia bacterium]